MDQSIGSTGVFSNEAYLALLRELVEVSSTGIEKEDGPPG